MTRQKPKRKRGARTLDQDRRSRQLAREALACLKDLRTVYLVDHISITRDQTRRMPGQRQAACMVERMKAVYTDRMLAQVPVWEDDPYHMMICRSASRRRSEVKRDRAEVAVEGDLEAINEVRGGSEEEVEAEEEVEMGVDVMSAQAVIGSHRMARQTTTSSLSSTSTSHNNITRTNNNHINNNHINNTRISNSLISRVRRTTHKHFHPHSRCRSTHTAQTSHISPLSICRTPSSSRTPNIRSQTLSSSSCHNRQVDPPSILGSVDTNRPILNQNYPI